MYINIGWFKKTCVRVEKEWIKFPPKTKESSKVKTAWIHPPKNKNNLIKK